MHAGDPGGIWDALRESMGFFQDIISCMDLFLSTKGCEQLDVPCYEWGLEFGDLLALAWEKTGGDKGMAHWPALDPWF